VSSPSVTSEHELVVNRKQLWFLWEFKKECASVAWVAFHTVMRLQRACTKNSLVEPSHAWALDSMFLMAKVWLEEAI
jgi:hypothetical protein